MNRIKLLPKLLVDKIAAGEVIERPASVVKELMENALDAGAKTVEIIVEDGGKQLVQVTDDGQGIMPDDLPLLFSQHTTSKIADESDLFAISTFGFRGEALASIGAIAQVQLVSRTPDAERERSPERSIGASEAYALNVIGGTVSPPEPAPGAPGTVIRVANLFFNTPARRRFLRSASVELGHITNIVTRYALAYPEVRFVLINGKARLIDLAVTSDMILRQLDGASAPDLLPSMVGCNSLHSNSRTMTRLSHFFGADVAREMEYVERQGASGVIRAYISKPTYTKPNSKYQFYYVNRRYIRDRVISRAIAQSYYGLIPPGQYPFVVLFLDIPPDAVDVNAHPTKIEVRFRQGWQLHDEIINAIRGKLVAGQPDNQIPVRGGSPHEASGQSNSGFPLGQTGPMKALVDFFSNPQSLTAERERSPEQSIGAEGESPDVTSGQAPYNPLLFPLNKGGRGLSGTTMSPDATSGRYLQVHNAFIIVETADGVAIIDQHALHERLLYTAFSAQLAANQVLKQRLLIPQAVELTHQQHLILRSVSGVPNEASGQSALEHLKTIGFEIEDFGQNTVRIQAIPALLGRTNLAEFIREFLDEFTDESKSKPGHPMVVDRMLKMTACKAAIKAGDPMKPEEIKALLDIAEQSGYTATCPHGRPAIYKISASELAKYFRRSVSAQ